MKVNHKYLGVFFFVMCVGLILLALMKWKNRSIISEQSETVEGFLDHDIKEDRNKFRFHPYDICWMKRAKEYDQAMLRKKAGEVEMGTLCQPGWVNLGRENLDVDLWSYPELVFHPVDNPREDLLPLDI